MQREEPDKSSIISREHHLHLSDGIYISENARKKYDDFERAYTNVRKKEGRILTIDEIRKLPELSTGNDKILWMRRKRTVNRFLKYLEKRGNPLKILDVGCGNGFFTHQMSLRGHQLYGLDVNHLELLQAREAFAERDIKWICADIMEDQFPWSDFDLITFNASFQYFKDSVNIIKKCFQLLNAHGEIHIMDSPFYKDGQVSAARQRSRDYYESMGVEEMSDHYFHHGYAEMSGFPVEVMFRPSRWKTIFLTDSPFPWLRITNGR
jgi:ubiquinone/menaquinone biosynthesis C-methylase UbiE